MSSVSIFSQLETSLHEYLSRVIERANTSDDNAAAALARIELPRIATALQQLLEEHEPDEHGRCRRCRPRLLGRAPAPCRAYLTAHLCLLVTEDDQRPPDTRDIGRGLQHHVG